jgi:Ca2+-dependent lipid-binding protein
MRLLSLEDMNITSHLANLLSDEILKQALLKVEKTLIRFYAISGFNMASRDIGSASDTYLAVECNGKRFSERDNYQVDEPNPDFHKCYEFEGHFPGTSPLVIQVWDYDMIFGDELVGESVIDLEDRYFTLDWMGLKNKPVEYRSLFHPSSKASQGEVKCWVEINPIASPIPVQVWDIAPKPPVEMEIRICVLNCTGIPMMDAEGTCDAYFRGFFDTNEDVQETDTHFRCTDGKPDFQYRLVYNVQYPKKQMKWTIQGYDRDFFKSNDMFGEAVLDLSELMEDVSLIKAPLSMNKEYYQNVIKPKHPDLKMEFDSKDPNKMFLQLWAKNKKSGKMEKAGKVGIKADVYPKSHAVKNPVGKARDTPNHSPTLPAPEGRIEFSFNPIKMLNQMIGPALRRKIYMGICCALCCALFIMVLPNILGAVISKAIVG